METYTSSQIIDELKYVMIKAIKDDKTDDWSYYGDVNNGNLWCLWDSLNNKVLPSDFYSLIEDFPFNIDNINDGIKEEMLAAIELGGSSIKSALMVD